MPVLLIENDPFAANAATFADQKDEPSPSNMRRPLWGMVSKLSPKHVKVAYLTVMAKNGKKIGTHNSSAPGGYGESNSNFIINSIDTDTVQEPADVVLEERQSFVILDL